MKNAIKKFWDSEDGMGVVEVVFVDNNCSCGTGCCIQKTDNKSG